MGVDRSLIDDQTYFLIETLQDGETILVGCERLYGGDQTDGRDDSFSNPEVDALEFGRCTPTPTGLGGALAVGCWHSAKQQPEMQVSARSGLVRSFRVSPSIWLVVMKRSSAVATSVRMELKITSSRWSKNLRPSVKGVVRKSLVLEFVEAGRPSHRAASQFRSHGWLRYSDAFKTFGKGVWKSDRVLL